MMMMMIAHALNLYIHTYVRTIEMKSLQSLYNSQMCEKVSSQYKNHDLAYPKRQGGLRYRYKG